jgi:site-specific recombinase XerD
MQGCIAFAPHLLELGVDLRYIEAFSGKTTAIYSNLTKKGMGALKSLLDFLDI